MADQRRRPAAQAFSVEPSRTVRQDGPIRDIPGLRRLPIFYDPDDNALMPYEDLQGAG